jgi:hypothetical protein
LDWININNRDMKKIRRILAYHNIIMWFHKCNYDMNIYEIEMENNTVFLVNQCACGKTDITRVHRESSAYMIWCNSIKPEKT